MLASRVERTNSWLLSRVSARVVTAVAGGALGWWLGQRVGHPALLALLGAAAAVLCLTVLDTLKGYQVLDWLRTPEANAPEMPGLWGEVAHRVQRVVRQRDQLIAEERRRLDQFLSGIQASPNGVILLDDTEHITWISTVAADHFGLDPTRDLYQRVTNLIRQPTFVQYLQAGDYREPVKCLMPRGGQGFLSLQVCRYGEGLKLILSQDITERERSDTMRRDFVANVSHEIRTPLTVLNGFIETLGSLPLTEVERARVITLMAQQAERMRSLVADLLTLAQIEGSPRPSSDRWIKVEALMQRLENDGLGLSRGRHPMSFSTDGGGQVAEISGVESEWLSAMGNLVSNAVRYTPDGAPIDVRWITLPEGGGEFSVRDSGIGIEAEHIPRLTERFYRVDGSRSRETGGTGLGLSIVKHVVQRHGGELRVTSEPGKGSTFSLTVPAARVRPA
ncbi:phosphate regulon sensor histidine kinase PhoR [Aquabacterium sp.]|uniref:phosphate regulon sensor histidine kinase PhoR n=1 Tax=Aquabacterium sp. TaxID=1872578 RepID=UPI003D6D6B43